MPATEHRTFSRTSLRQARERAGLSRTQLGYLLSRTEQTIYLWESGKTHPSSDMLGLIAVVLGCSIDDLFALSNRDDPALEATGPSKSRRDGTRHGER